MSEDLGRLTDGDLGHLTGEDLKVSAEQERADTDRKHGEHILDAVEASARASEAQKPHPLVEAIARAYQAREGEQE